MHHIGDPHRFLQDPELPPVNRRMIDAHVHLFPPRVFEAIWRWFHENGWPIRYQEQCAAILDYLERQNVDRLFALHYSHKAGMARALNAFISELASHSLRIVPFGTVLPGEPDELDVIADSLDARGHVGLKLHCHVQRFAPDDPVAFPVYEAVARRGKLLVLHAGREPHSVAYGFDCRSQCGVEPIRRVVERYPELKLIVPHLGMDEWKEFLELTRVSPNLYLDTSMAVSGYMTEPPDRASILEASDRLLFGTDFPNLPYPWGRELHWLIDLDLPEDILDRILYRNAVELAGLEERPQT